MLATDLKKNQRFRVVGWDEDFVLTTLAPCGSTERCTYLGCGQGREVKVAGLAILATRGKRVGELFQEIYALPVSTEIELI